MGEKKTQVMRCGAENKQDVQRETKKTLVDKSLKY